MLVTVFSHLLFLLCVHESETFNNRPRLISKALSKVEVIEDNLEPLRVYIAISIPKCSVTDPVIGEGIYESPQLGGANPGPGDSACWPVAGHDASSLT